MFDVSLGQTRKIDIPVSSDGDTSVYCISTQEKIKAIDLTDLKDSRNAIAMRIWTEKEIIELNYSDSNNITLNLYGELYLEEFHNWLEGDVIEFVWNGNRFIKQKPQFSIVFNK